MVVVFPAVTKRVIDEVLIEKHPERLGILILRAALALVVRNGVDTLRIILNKTFERKVIIDLRSDLYSHIQMLRLR
jgi:ABC-type bacteriocin/lantibiotic exporter with double-glycine peptidase domain